MDSDNENWMDNGRTDDLKFSVWFQINKQRPVEMKGLDVTTYVGIKHNDKFAAKFFEENLKSGKILNFDHAINVVYKSIDKIDYNPILFDNRTVNNEFLEATGDIGDQSPEKNVGLLLICKHCRAIINDAEHIPQHECFINREVYLDEGMLFAIDPPPSTSAPSTSALSTSALSTSAPSTSTPSTSASTSANLSVTKEINSGLSKIPSKGNNIVSKTPAVWSEPMTIALLSLCETHKDKMKHSKKKTDAWAAISKELKEMHQIEMSADQVRWKINSLMTKYKECIDNNAKSGRGYMDFQFFGKMEEIFGKERAADATFTLGNTVPSKRKDTKIEKGSPPATKRANKASHQLQCSEPTDSNNEKSPVESQSMKTRKPRGTGSERARAKLELEKQFLHHMDTEAKRRAERDVLTEKLLEKRVEANQLKKRQLSLQERQLDQKKTIEANKQKFKDRRHDEMLQVEQMKIELLKKWLKNDDNTSDTEN